MDRGAWWATVYKAAESRTQWKQRSSHSCYELSRWRKLWLIPLLMANIGTRSDFTVEAKFQLKRAHDKQHSNGTTAEIDISL